MKHIQHQNPIYYVLIAISIIGHVHCYSLSTQKLVSKPVHVAPTQLMAATIDDVSTDTDGTTSKGLLKRDRYVATNRFAVRIGQQAKFEKRWATRKSRLATLPGFKYFHLMRRVKLQNDDGTCVYDEGTSDETAQENYVSFTIWEKKSDFSAWRSGEAFKEAHGGTSITAFLSTMVNSAFVLRGAPRPAFYDGLLLQKNDTPTFVPETVDGWRNVEADGINTLPAECFVEMIKYYIPSGDNAKEFEETWKMQSDKVSMKNVQGFVTSSLLRRDGQAKGHGVTPMDASEPSYVATTIFQDRTSYEQWKATASAASLPVTLQRTPETVYYEGTLVISSAEGP